MTSVTSLGTAPDHGAGEDRPASAALNQVFAIFPALLRLTCGLAGAAVALAVRTPPVSTALLVGTVVVLTGWSLLFTASTLGRGLTAGFIYVDLTLTIVCCLLINRLVAAEVLPGEEAGWPFSPARRSSSPTSGCRRPARSPPDWSSPPRTPTGLISPTTTPRRCRTG